MYAESDNEWESLSRSQSSEDLTLLDPRDEQLFEDALKIPSSNADGDDVSPQDSRQASLSLVKSQSGELQEASVSSDSTASEAPEKPPCYACKCREMYPGQSCTICIFPHEALVDAHNSLAADKRKSTNLPVSCQKTMDIKTLKIRELEEDVTELGQNLAERDLQLAESNTAKAASEIRIAELETRNAELEAGLADVTRRAKVHVEEATEVVETARKEKDAVVQMNYTLQHEVKTKTSECVAYRLQASAAQNALAKAASMTAERDQSLSKNAELQKEVQELQNQLISEKEACKCDDLRQDITKLKSVLEETGKEHHREMTSKAKQEELNRKLAIEATLQKLETTQKELAIGKQQLVKTKRDLKMEKQATGTAITNMETAMKDAEEKQSLLEEAKKKGRQERERMEEDAKQVYQDLESTRAELTAKHEQIREAHIMTEQARAELRGMRITIGEKQAAWRYEHDRTAEQLSEANKKLADCLNELAAKDAQIKTMTSGLDNSSAYARRLSEEKVAKTVEFENLVKKLNNACDDVKLLNEEVAFKNDQIKTLTQKLGDLAKEATSRDNQINTLTKQLGAAHEDVTKEKGNVKRANEENAILQTRRTRQVKIMERQKELIKKLAEVKKTHEGCEEQATCATNELDHVRQMFEESKKQVHEYSAKYAASQKTIAKLEETVKTLSLKTALTKVAKDAEEKVLSKTAMTPKLSEKLVPLAPPAGPSVKAAVQQIPKLQEPITKSLVEYLEPQLSAHEKAQAEVDWNAEILKDAARRQAQPAFSNSQLFHDLTRAPSLNRYGARMPVQKPKPDWNSRFSVNGKIPLPPYNCESVSWTPQSPRDLMWARHQEQLALRRAVELPYGLMTPPRYPFSDAEASSSSAKSTKEENGTKETAKETSSRADKVCQIQTPGPATASSETSSSTSTPPETTIKEWRKVEACDCRCDCPCTCSASNSIDCSCKCQDCPCKHNEKRVVDTGADADDESDRIGETSAWALSIGPVCTNKRHALCSAKCDRVHKHVGVRCECEVCEQARSGRKAENGKEEAEQSDGRQSPENARHVPGAW